MIRGTGGGDRITLVIEEPTSDDCLSVWHVTPSPSWTHLRTEGECLVFFETPSGLRVAANGFRWNGQRWIHASCSRKTSMPTYADLCELKQAIFGDGFAAQLFVPSRLHVNIHAFCLHLWGPMDENDWPMPVYGEEGTI